MFVFAAQMINFPVGAGTSGHLLGGVLAAVLVGPWVATLCLTVVLLVQALVFADGGLTALGTNVTLMALVAVGVLESVARSVLEKADRTDADLADELDQAVLRIALRLDQLAAARKDASLRWVGADARIGIGLCLWGLGRMDAALRAWRRAAAARPRSRA